MNSVIIFYQSLACHVYSNAILLVYLKLLKVFQYLELAF